MVLSFSRTPRGFEARRDLRRVLRRRLSAEPLVGLKHIGNVRCWAIVMYFQPNPSWV